MDNIVPLASKCRVASVHDTVYNSECAFTFHNPFTTYSGIVVNLSTFIGTIDSLALVDGDIERGLFVRIARTRVAKEIVEGEMETTSSVTKLGLGVDGGFQQDDTFEVKNTYSVVLLERNHDKVAAVEDIPYNEGTKNGFPMNVTSSVDSIINHAGQAVQQDLKAFELDEEKPVSKYATSIDFVDNGVVISPSPIDWKCEKSGDTENIWLNLSTGFIGGGRKNWDGSGGSNGALDYFEETGEKYPLVVKLGTITEDLETADCYSYAKDEDGPVKIPNLADLLKKRGINVSGMQKTVKSTAELEVELNATYAFDAITESGAKLVPVAGPGLQGLQNLGNSCYINSIVQMLFSGTVPELSARYGAQAGGNVAKHPLFQHISPIDAPSNLMIQTAKLCCALTSGAFAPTEPAGEVTYDMTQSNDPKYRLPPRMFKHAVGKDHVDFCTGQQQDAAQFLQHLLEKLDAAELASNGKIVNKTDASMSTPKSSDLFAFGTTSRLVCSQDGKIKYNDNHAETMLSLRVPIEKAEQAVRPTVSSKSSSEPEEKKQKAEEDVPTVTLSECINSWSNPPPINELRWEHLNKAMSPASQQITFRNFSRYLIIQVQRYELGPDWTPRKLEVNIEVPGEIDLNHLKSKGPQDGEDIVPDDKTDSDTSNGSPDEPNQINIDEAAVAQLMDMGFGMNGCIRALNAVGGSNVELAMNWIFEHNGDSDFNDPLSSPSSDPSIDEGVVSSLVQNLGCFTGDQVRAALQECDGAADRAADWLFSHMDDIDGAIAQLRKKSIDTQKHHSPPVLEDGDGRYRLTGLVSHIGKNTGSGHYVAHLRKDEQWVIFNDEKVAISENPPTPHAYLYLYQRIDSIGSQNSSY